jgi:hypothetical protein
MDLNLLLKSLEDTANTEWQKEFSKIFKDALEEKKHKKLAHHFVCSFSRDGDALGQWRAYGDNGFGYALGFDGHILEKAFSDRPPDVIHSSFPVIYREEELCEIYRGFINEAFQVITKTDGSYDVLELFVKLAGFIIYVSALFKHKAYDNEEEYRFLQIHQYSKEKPLDDVCYRVRPYALVGYKEFDWRKIAPNALKEIVIGPANVDRPDARQFVKDCLRTYHYFDGVQITTSKIPYRVPR